MPVPNDPFVKLTKMEDSSHYPKSPELKKLRKFVKKGGIYAKRARSLFRDSKKFNSEVVKYLSTENELSDDFKKVYCLKLLLS